MSYYRAALAAASSGDLTGASRLVRCSLALNEDAPNASRLWELLREQNYIAPDTLNRLRALTEARHYKKALKVELPETSLAHTIRGLLFAQMGRRRNAREEFTLALTLDTGNKIAKQALLHCDQIKGGFLSWIFTNSLG